MNRSQQPLCIHDCSPAAPSVIGPGKSSGTEKLPPCIAACPQGIDIRQALVTLAGTGRKGYPPEDAIASAWRTWTETNPLPAVCGRVCPHPCESVCIRGAKDGALAISHIERFLGDWSIQNQHPYTRISQNIRDERVAVVGAGPAGLSCAYHVARRGFGVTVLEALLQPGGMLRYGIPSYRLPRRVLDAEIQKILGLGVELRTGVRVGKDVPYQELQKDYDAIFLAIGAQQGARLYCPGEDAENVITGLDFLHTVNTGGTLATGGRVVVIGGGDTAVDAARVALRLGADVTIIYRRTRREMPAIDNEISSAEEEGALIRELAAPIEFIIRDGRARLVRCQRMKLEESNGAGHRPRPVPIPGEEFTVEADLIITAATQLPAWGGLASLQNDSGWIDADGWGATPFEKTYAGGDILEPGLVTEAIADGNRAADAIAARLDGVEPVKKRQHPIIEAGEINLNHYPIMPRNDPVKMTAEARLASRLEETTSTLPEAEAVAEAERCFSCGTTVFKRYGTLSILRRVTQLGVGTLLLNSYFAVFTTRQIYSGPLRQFCVPGLSCHACPTATMGCPIGMMQHFASTHRFPFYLIGFLGAVGLISGRFTCGWLCPFGLLQDVMHAFKRLTVRIPQALNYLKYAVLVGLVFVIPYLTFHHWFSKLCPCGALMAGIPWALWNPDDPVFGMATIAPESIGTMFWAKIWILAIFLVLFLFIKRPFCRTVCPLGATYALFNRVSLLSLKVRSTCTGCGRCVEVCPTDLNVATEVNSENCIKCYECLQCEHIKFHLNLPWRSDRRELVPQPAYLQPQSAATS